MSSRNRSFLFLYKKALYEKIMSYFYFIKQFFILVPLSRFYLKSKFLLIHISKIYSVKTA